MKKLIPILLIMLLPIVVLGQSDSIFGTYVTCTLGNSPVIKFFSDSTFSYKSPLDIGYVPETFGKISFSIDTVYFKYQQKIHPEITNSINQFNPNNKSVKISVSGNFSWYDNIALYINEPFSDNGRIISFDSIRTVTIDSIKETDNLFIHVGMYSWIPISINFKEYNEFIFQILLPLDQTIFYLTEEKALLKNGLMFFSMTDDGVPYYNTNVYQKKKEIKKIRQLIWERRMNEINKNYR